MKKLLLLLVMLLAACSQQAADDPSPQPQPTPTEEQPSTEEPAETPETEIDLHDYFMPNQSIASFLGDGNEYATYTLSTQHLYENYIGTLEDNGGTVMQRIYRVEENRIVKIFEQAEAYDADFPALSELESMPELEIYLSLPFEVGHEFNGWTITDTNASLETPYQNFSDVLVMEQEGSDGSILQKYFAQGFGEVKRVFKMPGGEGEQFEVTSTLESVE
ncbi:hypothetical protein CQS04_02000 [Chryseomicrobium excrementi]|uniref:Uncharacterized protein n=1 Tax=Chryseomicrobium excrementi TaxID=2041346 RepID=A0A2M9F2I3_9BACL|nr:hypothetical protein [Chryseomicrobium excrementi]PJK17672.1 hypothetical protein CQS04_02000 [Chryseomicrobium excrementi]